MNEIQSRKDIDYLQNTTHTTPMFKRLLQKMNTSLGQVQHWIKSSQKEHSKW